MVQAPRHGVGADGDRGGGQRGRRAAGGSAQRAASVDRVSGRGHTQAHDACAEMERRAVTARQAQRSAAASDGGVRNAVAAHLTDADGPALLVHPGRAAREGGVEDLDAHRARAQRRRQRDRCHRRPRPAAPSGGRRRASARGSGSARAPARARGAASGSSAAPACATEATRRASGSTRRSTRALRSPSKADDARLRPRPSKREEPSKAVAPPLPIQESSTWSGRLGRHAGPRVGAPGARRRRGDRPRPAALAVLLVAHEAAGARAGDDVRAQRVVARGAVEEVREPRAPQVGAVQGVLDEQRRAQRLGRPHAGDAQLADAARAALPGRRLGHVRDLHAQRAHAAQPD